MPKDRLGGKRAKGKSYLNSIKANDFILKKDVNVKSGNKELVIPKGTKVTGVRIIAGKPHKRKIDEIERIKKQYNTEEKGWTKRRATIMYNNKKREIHYYQNSKIGKVEFKFKIRGKK